MNPVKTDWDVLPIKILKSVTFVAEPIVVILNLIELILPGCTPAANNSAWVYTICNQ